MDERLALGSEQDSQQGSFNVPELRAHTPRVELMQTSVISGSTTIWVKALLIQVARWIAVLPAAVAVAAAAYLVTGIVNSIGGELASGIVGLIAIGVAGYAAVAAAQFVAPTVKRAAGTAIAVMIVLMSCYSIGNGLTGTYNSTTYPLWYTVLLETALAVGAVSGIAVEIEQQPVPSVRVHSLVRWLVFVPVAILSAGAVGVLLVFTEYYLPNAAGILKLEGSFLFGLLFISVATAVAPHGRRIIASLLGALWVISGTLYFIGALLRPVLKPWAESISKHAIDFYEPAWLQAFHGIAWIAAAAIPIVVAFNLPRVERNETVS